MAMPKGMLLASKVLYRIGLEEGVKIHDPAKIVNLGHTSVHG